MKNREDQRNEAKNMPIYSVFIAYTHEVTLHNPEGASPRAYVMLLSVYADKHVVGIVLMSLYPGNG